MTKKIVVIGATGKVGSKVANSLLKQGYKPILIARNAENLQPFKQKGAEVLAISMLEVDKLTAVLKGADVVVTLIVSNHLAEDFLTDQRQQADAQIEAIKNSGIKNVVNISSNGCHVAEDNGVIQGLSEMEEKLNQLQDVNVIHLRPTFYMENTFYALGLIKHQGIYGLPINGEKSFPFIATADVAKVIVEKVTTLSFKGKSVLPILGPKDYNLNEVTKAIGASIGKESLPYIQFPVADFIGGVISTGGSTDFANKFAELMVATDNGLLNTHSRNEANTTSTTIEEFAQNVFAPVYNLQ